MKILNQKFVVSIFSLIGFVAIHAQSPFPDLNPVFPPDEVCRIDINLPADSLALIYEPGNEESNYHFHATYIFASENLIDTVNNIGFRLRGNTSRYSAKKSFKVSFNTYDPGRQWYGLEKLNLNGEHNDPTVLRSKLCWDMLRELGSVGSRAGHTDLYINGVYYGLYVNVEHIDEEFVDLRYGNKDGNLYKCLWPADLTYRGNDPNNYKFEHNGRRTYDLKTNEDIDDYSDIAEFIDVLNNTNSANFRCELERVFNVQDYLKTMAFDVMSGNWDGPLFNKNNFYLYHNTETDLFEYIPYDLDNTLGIDWLNQDWGDRNPYFWAPSGESRPLFSKIIAVPEYRARYSHYLEKIAAEIFDPVLLYSEIDNIRLRLMSHVTNDPFYPIDYGFSIVDFHNSYDIALPLFHTPYGLREYISFRRETLFDQLDNANIAPIISEIIHNFPGASEEIIINASIEDDNSTPQAQLCYVINDQLPELCVQMYDDGQHGDGAFGDGVYGASLSPISGSATIEYYIQADDGSKTERRPICDYLEMYVNNSAVTLSINEFMASNDMTIADEFNEYDDWVEIYNYGITDVYLGDKFLSDRQTNPDKWQFPDIFISPGEYLVVWTDNDEEQGDLHTDFSLKASGEYIGIFDSEENNFSLIDGFTFQNMVADQAIGRLPDGTGPMVDVVPTPGNPNEKLVSIIELHNVDPGITLYPNPVGDELFIYRNNQDTYEAVIKLYLFDISGKLVYSSILESKNQVFLINNLESGIYTYRIYTGNKVQVGKVLKL